MLKLLWLLFGGLTLLGALWLAVQECAWRKQQLRQRFAAYLQTSDGRCHPILSEETVVGRSRRAADLVLSIPGARTKAQKAALDGIAPCHLEVLRREGTYYLRNLQAQRQLSLLREGNCLVFPLSPGQELPLLHGDEIRLTQDLSIWFYEGEVF